MPYNSNSKLSGTKVVIHPDLRSGLGWYDLILLLLQISFLTPPIIQFPEFFPEVIPILVKRYHFHGLPICFWLHLCEERFRHSS